MLKSFQKVRQDEAGRPIDPQYKALKHQLLKKEITLAQFGDKVAQLVAADHRFRFGIQDIAISRSRALTELAQSKSLFKNVKATAESVIDEAFTDTLAFAKRGNYNRFELYAHYTFKVTDLTKQTHFAGDKGPTLADYQALALKARKDWIHIADGSRAATEKVIGEIFSDKSLAEIFGKNPQFSDDYIQLLQTVTLAAIDPIKPDAGIVNLDDNFGEDRARLALDALENYQLKLLSVPNAVVAQATLADVLAPALAQAAPVKESTVVVSQAHLALAAVQAQRNQSLLETPIPEPEPFDYNIPVSAGYVASALSDWSVDLELQLTPPIVYQAPEISPFISDEGKEILAEARKAIAESEIILARTRANAADTDALIAHAKAVIGRKD